MAQAKFLSGIGILCIMGLLCAAGPKLSAAQTADIKVDKFMDEYDKQIAADRDELQLAKESGDEARIAKARIKLRADFDNKQRYMGRGTGKPNAAVVKKVKK